MADPKELSDRIAKHREEADKALPASPVPSDVYDALEYLMAGREQLTELAQSLQSYIATLDKESNSMRRIRFWSVVLAVIFIVGVTVGLYLLTVWTPAVVAWFDEKVVIAFVAGSFVGVISVLIVLLRGAFKVAETASDGRSLIPPHLKELLDAAKTVIGR